MPWPKCNQTAEYEKVSEIKLPIGITTHHLGLVLSASFGLASVLLSLYLIWKHGTHYLKPYEQKHIIRILFMVPVYAIVSFLSYVFYTHEIYFAVIRDCYEAIAIASFFTLLCHYIAPDLHSQKDYFRTTTPKPWLPPISWFHKCCGGQRGPWRLPRSGLTWFNIVWFFVFQYCFIRVFMTIVSVISQAFHRYCLESLSPAFAHIWTTLITAMGVTLAMYCLIQFYYQLKGDLSEHRPFLKLVAIKLVIFLSFWQTIIISFLTSANVIKPSPRVGQPDIKIGIPSLLLCMEMSIFAVLHLWAYPWRVYDINRSPIVAAESGPGYLPDPETAYKGGPLGWRAYFDAMNMMDVVRGVGRGVRWVFVGRKSRELDVSYKGFGLRSPSQGQRQSRHSEVYVSGGKPGPYQRLDNLSDDRISTQAPNHPPPLHQDAGDMGNRRYDMDPYTQPNPSIPARTEYGIAASGEGGIDTGYHGARNTPARSNWPAGQGDPF